MRSLKNASRIGLSVIIVSALVFPAILVKAAEKGKWWPAKVTVTSRSGEEKKIEYIPPKKAKKPYTIGALVPHLKDPYWVAVNYGFVEECKRLGVKMIMLSAGGYDNLSQQMDQMEDLVQKGVNGILIGAVNADALGNKADEIWRKNKIPVVAMVIDVKAENALSKVFYYYTDVGRAIGEYIQNKGGGKVVVFAGPAGASWAEDTYKGLKKYVDDNPGKIEILAVKYGDTGKETQLKLVEDALQTFPKIDYIVGNAVAAAAAPVALKAVGKDQIKVIAQYLTPEIIDYMKEGKISASVIDHATLFSRIALDVLVEYLDGKRLESIPRQVMSTIEVMSKEEMGKKFVWDLEFAPPGFEPQFTVK